MALNANKPQTGGKKFAPQANIAAGVYPARLVQLIDLGLQAQRPFQGKEKAPVQEIMLTYELVDEFMKDEEGNDILDKPRWVSETLPFHGLFADKAKSTQRYLAFDPKQDWAGDFSQAVGLPINVAIVNEPDKRDPTKIYDNIATISAMRPRDAQQCPELKNPTKVFDLDAPDMEAFNTMPKWVQDKIKGNLNFAGSALQKALGNAPAEKKEVKKEEIPADDAPDAGGNNPY